MADRIVKVVLRGEIGDFTAKMATAGSSVAGVAHKMTAAGKEGEKFRQGLDELGSTAGKISLAATAGLGVMIATAANFEQAMSHVEAATHESTKNMEALRDAALEAGAQTAFSASEAAAGIENLAKAGVSTQDILDGGLMGALDLAAAGTIGVAEAAEFTATALTQFQLAGDQATHVADLLAAAAGKAQGEVADMALALDYAGVPAAALGVSIEETAGTIALLAKNGIIGERAGTSMRGMLASLTSPSEKAAEEMDKLGISVFDAQGKFIGFNGVADQLQQALGKATDAQRANSLGIIFGTEQLQAANVLYREGAAGVDQWTQAVNDQGYAAETAALKMDNLKGDLEELGGSVETTLIKMGSGSQGPMRDLVQGLTGVVNAFGDLPPAAQGTITSLLAITAITGGGLWFGSKVIRGISDTRDALKNLGVQAGTTGRLLRTGLAGAAILGGIDLLNTAIDGLFDKNFDQSNLSRSLDALANGNVTGELADKFGSDLERIGQEINQAASGIQAPLRAFSRTPVLGGLFDVMSDVPQAVEHIEALDASLAGLVESGQAVDAEAIFERISEAALKQGVDLETLNTAFAEYRLAVANTRTPTTGVAGAFNFLNGVLDQVPSKAEAAATAQKKLDEATVEARDAARSQAEAWIGLGAGLDDVEVSFQDWLKSLEDQAKALDDFAKNSKDAADKGLRQGLIAALQEAGPAGALRMQQLADATDEEIKRANRAWKDGQREIQEYVDMKVPPKEIDVRTAAGLAKIDRLKEALRNIPDEIVNVILIEQKRDETRSQQQGVIGGSPEDYWSGGYTGVGGKYDPAGIVHRGEYVFSSEATQGNLAMLDRLHRQLRGYAVGGYVGQPQPLGGVGVGGFTLEELTSAILRARPVHNWTGTYEDFRRMAAAEAQQAAITGVF